MMHVHSKILKKLIAELDKPIEQIVIEARIVTITDESLKELGVRWGIFNPTEQPSSEWQSRCEWV